MEKQQSVEFELFGRTGMATTAHRCKSKRVSLRMTFIAGFNCADGIVLCADQLETDGVTKRYRCKIEGVIMDEEWAISWAGSGDGHVIDKFTDKLKRALLEVGPEFNQAEIELAVEAALTLINQDHPRNPIQVIAALWSKGKITDNRVRVARKCIYRGRSDNQCISRESDYCLAGMDVTLAEFILRSTFHNRLTVDEAIRLGVFTTALMKEYADGVGGDTNVLASRSGVRGWHDPLQNEIKSIESEIRVEEEACL